MFKYDVKLLEQLSAQELAEEVLEKVSKLFSKWSVVGSIMRGHKDWHDLDFIILASEKNRVKKISDYVVHDGEDRISILYKDKLQVDFFLVHDERAWELARVAWGYGKANIHLRAIAREKGCKLSQYEFVCQGKNFWTIDDLEKILEVKLPGYLKVDKHNLDVGGFFDPNSTVNEGRHRLIDPDGIVPKSYRRWKYLSGVPYRRGVSYVVGKCKATGKMVVQAVRFDKNEMTEDEAREWFFANEEAIMKHAICPGYEWSKEDWGFKEEQDV